MGFDQRTLRPLPPRQYDGWTVKPYLLSVDGAEISGEVRAGADRLSPSLLPAELAHPALAAEQPGTPAVAFSVLHQGKDAIWYNVYSWCYGAILQCRIGYATLDAPAEFTELTEPLIGCVWELPVLAHERSAWVRHVLTPQRPDVAAYLTDVLPAGQVGGP